jgi:hypothetical protein
VNRAAVYLTMAVRQLYAMQLVTGELPAVQWNASDSYYAPAPLISAIANDALAVVDVRDSRFVGRVRDLVSPSFFRGISSLRWRLRLYIASEEEADSTWQVHGRLGTCAPDAVTTACSATALLPTVRLRARRFDRRHVEALRRLARRGEWSTLEIAHALRYLSFAGVDTEALTQRLARDANDAQSLPTLHAIASALRHTRANASLRGAVTEQLKAVPAEGRLAVTLRTSALLDSDYEGSELDDALFMTMHDPTPPSLWEGEVYDENSRIGSVALILALNVANVARLAALPRFSSRVGDGA